MKPFSAGSAASTISRILRREGAPMCVKGRRRRDRWSDGISVSRIGVSSKVNVSYHIASLMFPVSEGDKNKRDAAIAQAQKILTARGYEISERHTGSFYIECEHE